MNNIIIYSSKPMPELEALLMDADEADVRNVDIQQMKDYAVLNPSLMVVENADLAKDALMTNKFPCPILFFIVPIFSDILFILFIYSFILPLSLEK